MNEKPNAQRRRRRALAARESQDKIIRPASRSKRRRITSRMREHSQASDAESWRFAPRDGYMGLVFDQPFYSCRYQPTQPLVLPFAKHQPFSCLINVGVRVDESEVRTLAEALLKADMRFALCTGVDGEIFSDVLNELLESGEYHVDGRSSVATSHSDDPIEEVMEYFALPSGMAPFNLVLSIGDETIFKATLSVFQRVVDKMRQGLCIQD
ncbi:MAG: hypothetical protein ACYTGH_02200 [Planctomycetota bacterium]|jgi:hypothetical protein